MAHTLDLIQEVILKAPTKLSTRLTVLKLTTKISIGRKSTVPTVTVKQLRNQQEKDATIVFQKEEINFVGSTLSEELKGDQEPFSKEWLDRKD